jgi:hypothetical protein
MNRINPKTLRTEVRVIYDRFIRAVNSKRVQPGSLLRKRSNKYSQLGDDGIISHILEKIGTTKGFFVEFGGWDGIHLSNTRALFEQGWDGAFIEADPEKFKNLQENYKDHPNIICINEYVTFDPADPKGLTFDAIADKYFPNQAIDLLSIDVDGMDYRIFESIKRRATLVIVEGGSLWHPKLRIKVPDSLSVNNLHQPLAVNFKLGRKKGYEPICFNLNTYFIDKEYFYHFSHIQNDAVSLWKDYWNHLYFYSRWSIVQRRKKPDIRRFEGSRLSNISFEQFFLDWLK